MTTRVALALLVSSIFAAALRADPAAAAERRVATLVPYAGAALAAHPGKVLVVAAVRSDPRTPVADGVIDLGSPHSPNLEKLAEARPEIVVTDAQMHGSLVEALGRTGARVFPLDSTSIDATFAGLEALGTELGIGPEIQADVTRTRAQLAELRVAQPVPTLVLFGAPGSFFVVTDKTWIGDLLLTEGFHNVAPAGATGGRFPGFAPLTDEVLIGLSPELVLLVAHGNPEGVRAAFERDLETRPAMQSVRKSATRGVHALDPTLFSANPGLELPRAARALRDLAQPPAATP
jgi:iron complex transport system substrate-binding protein